VSQDNEFAAICDLCKDFTETNLVVSVRVSNHTELFARADTFPVDDFVKKALCRTCRQSPYELRIRAQYHGRPA